MEIVGTGIDLVENARIAASIEKFGDRFLNRVFLPGELAYCGKAFDQIFAVAVPVSVTLATE